MKPLTCAILVNSDKQMQKKELSNSGTDDNDEDLLFKVHLSDGILAFTTLQPPLYFKEVFPMTKCRVVNKQNSDTGCDIIFLFGFAGIPDSCQPVITFSSFC